MNELIYRARYLHYGCCMSKEEAIKQARNEFNIDGTECRDICNLFDITINEFLESEI